MHIKKSITPNPHPEVKMLTFWHMPSLRHGLPRWLSGRESACQCRRQGFNPRVGKIPCRRKWQPAPVFLSGEPHGQRSLVGYSP